MGGKPQYHELHGSFFKINHKSNFKPQMMVRIWIIHGNPLSCLTSGW